MLGLLLEMMLKSVRAAYDTKVKLMALTQTDTPSQMPTQIQPQAQAQDVEGVPIVPSFSSFPFSSTTAASSSSSDSSGSVSLSSPFPIPSTSITTESSVKTEDAGEGTLAALQTRSSMPPLSADVDEALGMFTISGACSVRTF
jgi:hypothetical protein